MLINQKKLDLYVAKNFNVLFEGERGVGKTSIIYNTFEKAGLRVKYFSAPTMDPWTDLVGVPTTVERPDGKEVLRLVPPEDFVDDKYDVIFIDELNRAPPKVMNALMELIQFKTINGKPYNIKMIWAAVNPHTPEQEYHVEPLDPAVQDRFQIHIKIPYQVDVSFFKEKHGQTGEIFCQWWQNQTRAVQKEISPRRLFEATGFYLDGGDVADMLTAGNIQKLETDLKELSAIRVLESAFEKKDPAIARRLLSGNYSPVVEKHIKSKAAIFDFFLPELQQEWLAKEFINPKSVVYDRLLKAAQNTAHRSHKAAYDIIKSVVAASNATGPFMRKNLDDLKPFLSENEQKKLTENPYLNPTASLVPQNPLQNRWIQNIGDEKILSPLLKRTGTTVLSAKINTAFSIGMITSWIIQAENLISKNAITREDVKTQIIQRTSLVLAIGSLSPNCSKTQAFTQRLASLMDPKSKSYMWHKPSMPANYKDLGESIKEQFLEYSQHTQEDLLQIYNNLTAASTTKKRKTI